MLAWRGVSSACWHAAKGKKGGPWPGRERIVYFIVRAHREVILRQRAGRRRTGHHDGAAWTDPGQNVRSHVITGFIACPARSPPVSPPYWQRVFAIADIKPRASKSRVQGQAPHPRRSRQRRSGDVETGHTFLFTLNDEYVIDANYKGNEARWINHSCEPNCEAVHGRDDEGKNRKQDRVLIEAIRNIKPGEELTYNYGITLDEPHTARLKKVWECQLRVEEVHGHDAAAQVGQGTRPTSQRERKLK